MAVLTQEMKDMVNNGQCFIGTVSRDGKPNIGPKMTARIFNDETIIFNERTGGRTYFNILEGSKVTIAVANEENPDGFRFIGSAEVHTYGELYEKEAAFGEETVAQRTKAIILVHIDEIHSLKPGPMAGAKIG